MKNPTVQIKVKEIGKNKFSVTTEYEKTANIWNVLNCVEQVYNSLVTQLQQYAADNPDYKFATQEDLDEYFKSKELTTKKESNG